MKIRSSIILAIIAHCGVGTSALAHPASGIVVDQRGQVFFSDLSRGLLKIDAQGRVTTVHKEGGHWLALEFVPSLTAAAISCQAGHL